MAERLKSTSRLKGLMADTFLRVDRASKASGGRVAWCSSVGPVELLRALGFEVFFPENHSAMIGTSKKAADFIPYATALGYSADACSYMTSDIGAWSAGLTPMSRVSAEISAIPRPDVLVANTNQCRDVADWFAFYAREFDVPLVVISGNRMVGEVTEAIVAATANQLIDIVPVLEAVAGHDLDPEALASVVATSRETSRLWRRVLETSMHHPAPMTFFDACVHMGPAVVLRGDESANEYYRILLTELTHRIEDGVAAVGGESRRVYWEGMPIWGRLRSLSELFEGHGTAVVASTYCSSWVFDALDPVDPFMSMARAANELFITRTDDAKEAFIGDMVRRFKVDGMVFHDARTCPYNTNNRYGMPRRLEEALKVPSVVVSGDLNDLRMHSDANTKLAIEAFIERIDAGGMS